MSRLRKASIFIGAFLILLGATGLMQKYLGLPVRKIILLDTSKINRNEGLAFICTSNAVLPLFEQGYDPWTMRENGRALSRGEVQTIRVEEEGRGLFCVKHGRLIHFSSSDGSDPRTNGRRYEIQMSRPFSLAEERLAWACLIAGVTALVLAWTNVTPLGYCRRVERRFAGRAAESKTMIVSIQVLRGIAAWMVVFHHWLQMGRKAPGTNPLAHFFINYGQFGVDLFFVISGFVMRWSAPAQGVSHVAFMVNRIVRIVPAYWFFTLVLLFVAPLAPPLSVTQWNDESLVKSLLFIPHINPSDQVGYFPFLTVGWTLNYEMFFYAFLAFCLFLFPSRRAFLSCFVVLTLTPFFWPESWPMAVILSSPRLLEFAFGIALAHFVELGGLDKLKSGSFPLMTALLGSAWLMMHNKDWLVSHWNFPLVWQIASTFIVLAVIIGDRWLVRLPFFKPLLALGTISYSTYLCHTIVIGLAWAVIGYNASRFTESLALAVALAVIIIVSQTSFHFIEMTFSKKLRAQWRHLMQKA